MTGLDEAFNSGVVLTGKVTKGADVKWQKIGILFDYIQDETSSVEADITDNWVESNYTLQDHIAIKPRIYRIRGCVGEVIHENIYKAIEKLSEFKNAHPVFQKTANVLGGVSALSGTVSNYTRAAINVVKQIESSYDRYKQIYNNFRKANQIRGKRQAILYEMLVCMLQNRIPVKLENLAYGEEISDTSYLYNKLFFIQSVTAHQGDNAYISDIEVVVKEVRVAQTKTTEVDSSKYGGYVGSKATETAVQGSVGSLSVPEEVIDNFNKELPKVITSSTTGPAPFNAVPTLYSLIKSSVPALKEIGMTVAKATMALSKQ